MILKLRQISSFSNGESHVSPNTPKYPTPQPVRLFLSV